jgi:hypothetical protein
MPPPTSLASFAVEQLAHPPFSGAFFVSLRSTAVGCGGDSGGAAAGFFSLGRGSGGGIVTPTCAQSGQLARTRLVASSAFARAAEQRGPGSIAHNRSAARKSDDRALHAIAQSSVWSATRARAISSSRDAISDDAPASATCARAGLANATTVANAESAEIAATCARNIRFHSTRSMDARALFGQNEA